MMLNLMSNNNRQHNGNKKSDTPNLTDYWDNRDTTSDKT